MEIVAQIVGIAAMLLNIFSFQQKTSKRIILCQMITFALFTVHFGLLGAISGCMAEVVAMISAAVFYQKEKQWSHSKLWILIFFFMYLAEYVITFTVFGKKPTFQNLMIEFLPVIGMCLSTVSFYVKEAKRLRQLSIIKSPFWLCYDVINFSVGGILTEIFSLCSLLIAMYRFDRKARE